MTTSYENSLTAKSNNFPKLRAGDVLSIGLRRYKINSVASYALEYNDCPIEAIERAKENGHDLHFVFGLGASLTAHKQEIDRGVQVNYGDHIYFEGHIFELVREPNDNIGLKEVK